MTRTAAPGRIWCDLDVLEHAAGLCPSCPPPPPPPLRLTARGQRLGGLLLLALLFGGLLAAYLVGDHLRCQRLLDANSPLAAQHCPATPTSEETP